MILPKSIEDKIIREFDELLKERDKDILMRRLGLGRYKRMTFREIATIYQISKERVRQIESKALRRYRKSDYKTAFENKLLGIRHENLCGEEVYKTDRS